LTEHVKANLDQHRASGADGRDVTDALLRTAVDGARFDDDQIVSILRNWIAGEGTVAGGLSLLVLQLAERRDIQEQLRADPSLIPAAVEEILRVDDPLVANRRTTTRDVRIGDVDIPRGANLTLMWIAANRDERAFESAGEAHLDRTTEEGLLWGRGIHLCLGAPLARLQLRIALEELLARTSSFEVAGQVRRSVVPSDGLALFTLALR
jgi:cytochrome P450